ncbi:MAG: hypothetical protein ATN33_00315 [Epulopiscium sp. Nele67-Bin001]|nr:MAG: hypothetical protein ATN33_00315 [Epulopiscium sp. Nele67-Bin001]
MASPLREAPLTNISNADITHRNKSIFYEHWFNNIVLVKQLFDNDGLLYSYDKYGVPVSHCEYNTVVNALPAGIISSSRCSSDIYDSITIASYSITVDGISVFDKNLNNTFIRNSLSPRTVAPVQYKWTEQTLDGETWNAVFTLSYKYVLPNKI